ncbi:MAG: hypothetical protein LCI00_04760 [Chloroflexi bacterium]|nr:hypothetical protein [Chloroflexota bacterium]MCC6896364.1 hypothetical protein [Anaerolineae bacterium]
MNPTTPQSKSGQPITVRFDNVSHILMLGDQINFSSRGYRLTYQQQHQIHERMRLAVQQDVPLVIVLWPRAPKSIRGFDEVEVLEK